MNIDYLKNQILPQREKEIKEGKNLATTQPIYLVLDLISHVVYGHVDLAGHVFNNKGKQSEHGWADAAIDSEDRTFELSPKFMKKPEQWTQFYTDTTKAYFLTSQAAHEYLKYQSHNLKDPYVYVDYSGYGNKQMDALLNGK